MHGLSARFFGSAIIYAILGMSLGLHMGMSKDHSQMPTHAHLLVVGWVSFALFGVFYYLFPSAAASFLAKLQFWLAQLSLVTLIAGLFLIFSGYPEADPVAGISSIGLLVSMILFGIIALPTLRGRG
jgi:heme/copper-type cytochrome/quinol oxidase subunit 1